MDGDYTENDKGSDEALELNGDYTENDIGSVEALELELDGDCTENDIGSVEALEIELDGDCMENNGGSDQALEAEVDGDSTENNGGSDGALEAEVDGDSTENDGDSEAELDACSTNDSINGQYKIKISDEKLVYLLGFYSLLVKNFYVTIRSPVLLTFQIVVPIIFAVFACMAVKAHYHKKYIPPFSLNSSSSQSYILPFFLSGDPEGKEESQEMGQCYSDAAKEFGNPILVDQNWNFTDRNHANHYLRQVILNKSATFSQHILAACFIRVQLNSKTAERTVRIQVVSSVKAAIAISLSLINNAYLRCFGSADHSIITVNHPVYVDETTASAPVGFTFASVLTIGLLLLSCSLVLSVVVEKSSGVKRIMLIGRAGSMNYWTSVLVWNFVFFVYGATAICVTVYALGALPGSGSG